jgi:hypothetical protein
LAGAAAGLVGLEVRYAPRVIPWPVVVAWVVGRQSVGGVWDCAGLRCGGVGCHDTEIAATRPPTNVSLVTPRLLGNDMNSGSGAHLAVLVETTLAPGTPGEVVVCEHELIACIRAIPILYVVRVEPEKTAGAHSISCVAMSVISRTTYSKSPLSVR